LSRLHPHVPSQLLSTLVFIRPWSGSATFAFRTFKPVKVVNPRRDGCHLHLLQNNFIFATKGKFVVVLFSIIIVIY
jgi:hypothetical protein